MMPEFQRLLSGSLHFYLKYLNYSIFIKIVCMCNGDIDGFYILFYTILDLSFKTCNDENSTLFNKNIVVSTLISIPGIYFVKIL
jgi:hypothetical protein